jgi:sporulation protein YlmC with PRC-barrel domain
MSNTVYATEVSGKTVLDSNGAQIGRVSDIRVNPDNGGLTEVLVVENKGNNEQTPYLDYPKENGLYRIPIGNVQAVKDHILVE